VTSLEQLLVRLALGLALRALDGGDLDFDVVRGPAQDRSTGAEQPDG